MQSKTNQMRADTSPINGVEVSEDDISNIAENLQFHFNQRFLSLLKMILHLEHFDQDAAKKSHSDMPFLPFEFKKKMLKTKENLRFTISIVFKEMDQKKHPPLPFLT